MSTVLDLKKVAAGVASTRESTNLTDATLKEKKVDPATIKAIKDIEAGKDVTISKFAAAAEALGYTPGGLFSRVLKPAK